MAKFCGKCGAKLDENTGKCPNCDKTQEEKIKSWKWTRKRIISIIIIFSLFIGCIGGFFCVTFQKNPQVNDYTEDIVLKEDDSEEESAILSSNVNIFVEEDADEINSSISNVNITNMGLYIDVEKGTNLDDLGNGDVFFLEGDSTSPLGETYIGKVVEKNESDTATTYLIETPMVDEVFDVLEIDFSKEFEAEDIEYIETIEGVKVTQVDDIAKSFAEVSSKEGQYSVSTLEYRNTLKALQTSAVGNSEGDDLLLELEVDLLEVFGLQEEGAIGFEEYEYSEGHRVNVYITETGEKYHKENCSCLRVSKEIVSLTDAVDYGYSPCFLCVPPILKGEGEQFLADASLTLEGKIGLEDLKYSINYDWDILNGGGLEKFDANAKGNFVSEVGLKSELSLELGGKPTTISVPMNSVKLQGLKEKLFPIAFISYNGASLNVSSLFPGNDYINSVTSVVPITVGAIIYTDIEGNLTVDATAQFNFNYEFDCEYTAIEDGQWVNRWENTGEPAFKTALNVEVAGDVDAHVGCSVSLYVFNLNVAEIAVAKIGFEGEGNLKIEHTTEYKKLSEDWELAKESETEGTLYGRLYVKVLEMKIGLKTRIKVWNVVDFSGNINYAYTWLDKTIVEWGTRNKTRYNPDLMTYSSITAKDQDAIYYKDITGLLIKEEKGYKTTLYDKEFFAICGIDTSYIYLIISNEEKYEIRRVAKDGSSNKVIVEDVLNQLTMDEKYLYYVSTFDSTTIMRLDRESLKEEQFATFEDDVKFMNAQGENFYVVTAESGFFASFFGGTSNCYLLNSSGGILLSYGENPSVNQYYLTEYTLYNRASRMTSNGYLRDVASEVYWMSKTGETVILAQGINGWKSDETGIFTTMYDDNGDYQIVQYQAENGEKVNVIRVSSEHAFFTLCQSNHGEWYYFDQTESELILYSLSGDFLVQREIKRFSLNEISYNLTDCSMEIMDNRIYFYTMPNDSTSKVLYRYDLIIDGGDR